MSGRFYWPAQESPETGRTTPAQIENRNAPSTPAPVVSKRELPAAAAADVPLWQTIDEATVSNVPFYAAEWSTEGRSLVRVNETATAAQSWRVGGRLTIPLPQLGETYHPVIEEIDKGPGYSRAALGKVVDAGGQPRRVLVTVGPTSMFAYIDTPEGAYELVADSEFGWLLPTASMIGGLRLQQIRLHCVGERRHGVGGALG